MLFIHSVSHSTNDCCTLALWQAQGTEEIEANAAPLLWGLSFSSWDGWSVFVARWLVFPRVNEPRGQNGSCGAFMRRPRVMECFSATFYWSCRASPDPVCVGGCACLAIGALGGIGRLNKKGLNGGPSVQCFPAARSRDGWSPFHTPQTAGLQWAGVLLFSFVAHKSKSPFLLDFPYPPRILSSTPSQHTSPLSYP